MTLADRMMLKWLSRAHACLGRSRLGRRLLGALRPRELGRAWLRRRVLVDEIARPDDVTVLIGARNRADYRLANALASVCAQSGFGGGNPGNRLRTVVIDYGSEPLQAAGTSELCARFGAEYLAIDNAPVWSRARCLNIGIRHTTTKLVAVSDVDILFSPTYLADAVRLLKQEPLSVVCAPMLDLPEDSGSSFKNSAALPPLDDWKACCTPRFGWAYHPSIFVTYTAYLEAVRGYDEYFEVWGYEDLDLMRRLGSLGLDARLLEGRGYYLHQWHPKYEDVPGGEHAAQIERNRRRMEQRYSILRNDAGWGRGSVSSVRG